MSKLAKKERQKNLENLITESIFVSDEELAEKFNVSIQTIRLDRMEIGIPELRERMREAAQKNHSKIVGLGIKELVGEIIELEVNKSGMSFLETEKNMAFETTDIIRGYYIFSMAESLALAVIDKKAALTGVANMKYSKPVKTGEKLVARAEVTMQREQRYFIHVVVSVRGEQVFRGKFILVPVMDE